MEKYYLNELRVTQLQQETKRSEMKRKNASKWCSWKPRKKNTANNNHFADDEVDNDNEHLDAYKMFLMKKIATWNKLNTLIFLCSTFSGPSCSNVISGERKNWDKKIEFTFVRCNLLNLFDLFLCKSVVQFQKNMKLSVHKFHSQAAAGSMLTTKWKNRKRCIK